MLRIASSRENHNPKRQRGIALLTIWTGIDVLAHDADVGDEVDSLIEYSAEESLADASGYEREDKLASNPKNPLAYASGSPILSGAMKALEAHMQLGFVQANHGEQLESVRGGSWTWSHDVIESHPLYARIVFKVLAKVHDLTDSSDCRLIGQLQIMS